MVRHEEAWCEPRVARRRGSPNLDRADLVSREVLWNVAIAFANLIVDHRSRLMDQGSRPGTLPPYTSYGAFEALLSACSRLGVPSTLEHRLVPDISINVFRQLRTNCKHAGLVDDAARPTPMLRTLVEAYGGKGWKGALKGFLEAVYPTVIAEPLDALTMEQVSMRFQNQFHLPIQMERKVVSFFLAAARDADVPLSADVLSRMRERRDGAAPTGTAAVTRATPGAEPTAARSRERPIMEAIMDLYDPDVMTEEEERAVLTLMRFIKRRREP